MSVIAADRWLSSGIPVSSTNKTDRHDITEICSLYVVIFTTKIVSPKRNICVVLFE